MVPVRDKIDNMESPQIQSTHYLQLGATRHLLGCICTRYNPCSLSDRLAEELLADKCNLLMRCCHTAQVAVDCNSTQKGKNY